MRTRTMLALLFANWLVLTSSATHAQMGVDNFAVGSSPYGVTFDGTSIWVTNFGSNSVTRMRESDGACVVNGTVQPNLSACTFNVESEPIALTFDGAYIWVANYASSSVTMLRASDGSCNGVVNAPTAAACSIPVATNPRFLVSDGANIWVANQAGNNVYKIQASNGMLSGIFNVGLMPSGLAFDGTNIWVANYLSNAVTELRASDGFVVNTFSVTAPHGVVFDGSNIWVTNDVVNGTVTKLRASDGTNLGSFAVGGNPIGAAFDGNNIWVTNYSSSNVTELRASDGARLGTFNVAALPAGIVLDGADVWVANTGGSQVSKLFPLSSNPDTYIQRTGDWGCDTCWSLGHVPGVQPFWDDCAISGNSNVRIEGAAYCNNLTVAAGSSLTVAPGPSVGSLSLNGASINNSGTIVDGSSNGITVSRMTFLSGGGTINLTTLPGQIQTTIGGTGALVNVDNTIQGQGTIGWGGLNLINQKTIVASGGTLSTYGSDITNTGVLQAAGASTLQLTSGGSLVINNTFGKISALDTGTVVLFSGTIVNGGLLTTSGGSGVIQTSAGNVTLNGVTNAGAYTNYANTTLQGTITNNGVIYAPNGGIRISGMTTLKGMGILSGSSGQLIGSIPGISGGVLVNQSTIAGGGSIGDSGLTINNQGTINATNTSNHLVLAGSPATNTGLMEATGGATLEIGTTVINNGGTITAQSGSSVLLAQYGSLGQGVVNGGTLVADGTVTGTLNGAGIHQIGLQPGMTLRGLGTVVGDTNSSGTVIAGDSTAAPGLLTILGNYTQNSTGVLDITLGQCSPLFACHNPPPPQGQLAISQVANLSGTLNITLLSSANFAASVGNTFTILTAGAISGKFTSVHGLHINSNEHFAITYGATAVTLTIVPGP
jgi:hypothetical protein